MGRPLVVVLGNGQRYRLPTVEHYSVQERYVCLRDKQGHDVYIALSWVCEIIGLPVPRKSPPEA